MRGKASAGKCRQVVQASARKARQDLGTCRRTNSTQSICTTPVCRRAGAGYQKMVLTEILSGGEK